MQHDFDVLIDSDALVGWLLPDDAHFQSVSRLFANLEQTAQKLVTTSWVIAETATVLSARDGQETARRFLHQVRAIHLPIIHITEEFQDATTELFIAQQTKRTSMVDCSNVTIMQRFHIPKLFSYDKFYARFDLEMVA